MSQFRFRLYYHLYCGPSWRRIWAFHQPLLRKFADSGLLERAVVCVYGELDGELAASLTDAFEVRHISESIRQVNEFQTLQQMQGDVRDRNQQFECCVYLHSKGASSEQLVDATAEWSRFLATALVGALPGFGRIADRGFNCLGANLAFGLFEDFGRPRLHFSGNFWCATRELVGSAPEIELGGRHAAVRHNAEWWLSEGRPFRPFNVFSTGIDHYACKSGAIDWARLELRLRSCASGAVSADRAMAQIDFLRRMIERTLGRSGLRRLLSEFLLRTLPHHRWRRLLNVHDSAMRIVGSRKSAYFYCPETE